jgi:hypothetical protein
MMEDTREHIARVVGGAVLHFQETWNSGTRIEHTDGTHIYRENYDYVRQGCVRRLIAGWHVVPRRACDRLIGLLNADGGCHAFREDTPPWCEEGIIVTYGPGAVLSLKDLCVDACRKHRLDPRKHLAALPEDLAREVINVGWRKIT